jgi:dolichyl-phosphate-mannose--protein O-mannosyl transferase
MGRPVSFYYPSPIHLGTYGCQTPASAGGCAREILAIGTPAIWWAMLPVLAMLVFRWASKRDWVSEALVPLTLISILAWIPSDLKHRTMFVFYALPSVPFLCMSIALCAGWALGHAGDRRRPFAAAGLGIYMSLVVINFAYFYPILAAQTLSYTSWHHRMWFSSWI